MQPANPSVYRFIDLVNHTVNGVVQNDPSWPVAADGQTLGIHSLSGGTGSSWVEITFHQQSWGANGTTVFDLDTGTWSLLGGGDDFWSGHVVLGNGRFVNGSGSHSGADSRGMLVRSPDKLMDPSQYQFFMDPPTPSNAWTDCYYGEAFAQISNDGKWALFSSPWDGTLGTGPSGAGDSFGCATRIDTFLLELK